MLKGTPKPLRRRVLIEGLAKSSKKHLENTDKWHLCKAGSFSCGESLRTPPLEGTSLHRWNNSVERPWGILSLFTTCLQNHKKIWVQEGVWKTPQRKHSELKEPDGTLDKTKTLTIIAREKKAKEKAPDEAFNLERSPTKTLWTEQSLEDAKRNTKNTMKKSSDRRRPS